MKTNSIVIDSFKELFIECTQLGIDISDFAHTKVLAEAVDNIPVDSKSINKADTDSKIKTLVNKVTKWYYKIEPNKKFKVLHSVLKVLNSILYQCISKTGAGLVAKQANTKSKIGTAIAGAGVIGGAGAIGANTVSKYGMAKYTADNVASVLDSGKINPIDPADVLKAKTKYTVSGAVIGVVIAAVLSCVAIASSNMYAIGQYEMNMRDYEANINELRRGKERLEKAGLGTKEYDKAIYDLEMEKYKYDKLKNSKISARGAAIRRIESNHENVTIDRLYGYLGLCESASGMGLILDSIESLRKNS